MAAEWLDADKNRRGTERHQRALFARDAFLHGSRRTIRASRLAHGA
jgi:hypothetical protein